MRSYGPNCCRSSQRPDIEAAIEFALNELELQAQAQVTDATSDLPHHKRDGKSPKLPAFVHGKDELDSYLLRFEYYTENAKWEKHT